MYRQPKSFPIRGSLSLRAGASLAMFLGIFLGVFATVRGQEPAARTLGLQDCIALGMSNQPAIAGAQSSYGAALAGHRGLENLHLSILSPDLKVRRHQA